MLPLYIPVHASTQQNGFLLINDLADMPQKGTVLKVNSQLSVVCSRLACFALEYKSADYCCTFTGSKSEELDVFEPKGDYQLSVCLDNAYSSWRVGGQRGQLNFYGDYFLYNGEAFKLEGYANAFNKKGERQTFVNADDITVAQHVEDFELESYGMTLKTQALTLDFFINTLATKVVSEEELHLI